MPFGIKDYHRDLNYLHVGCEKPRAYFVPCSDESTALLGTRDYSDRFKALSGAFIFRKK